MTARQIEDVNEGIEGVDDDLYVEGVDGLLIEVK